MITIYFLRHAQTENNATQERIGGRSNHIALSDIGREQAEKARLWFINENLRINGIACSSALRAKQTLEGVRSRGFSISSNEVLYTDALNEVCQGDWEGQPRAEILTPEKLEEITALAPHFRAPNGESHKEAEERMMGFIQSHILDKYNKGTFLLIGHGLSFKCLLQGIMGVDPKMTYKIGCCNASLSRLRYEKERGWFVDYINRDITSEILPQEEDAGDILNHQKDVTPFDHIRLRPGIYIGKLGDGKQDDDGIYTMVDILLWNVINTSSKRVEFDVRGKKITVCYYDVSIPSERLNEMVTKLPKIRKYDKRHSEDELHLVNALSSEFSIASAIDGRCHEHKYNAGNEVSDRIYDISTEEDFIEFSYIADETIFGSYDYNFEYIKEIGKEFAAINTDVEVTFNGEQYFYKNGMLDLLNSSLEEPALYEPIHFKDNIIDIAFTHTLSYGVKRYFANGSRACGGGQLVQAFRVTLTKVLNEIFDTEYSRDDVCRNVNCAVSIELEEALFHSSIRYSLRSTNVREGLTIEDFLEGFLRGNLTKYFAEHPSVAEYINSIIKEHNQVNNEIEARSQELNKWEEEHGIISTNMLIKGPNDLEIYKIREGIVEIGKDAFQDSLQLREVTLPCSLDSLNKNAFPANPWFKIKTYRENRPILWDLMVQCGADNIELLD